MLSKLLRKLVDPPVAARPAPKVERRVVEVPVAVASPKGVGDIKPVPIYPPSDGGMEIVDAGMIVDSQAELINVLRRHVALPPEEFDRQYSAPITRLAAYVGLLPATQTQSHSGAGGLFRFALAMGVGCARAADGVNWSDGEPVEIKREVEAAWKLTAFLAGLCCELYRPLIEMHVFTANGQQWGPYIGGLSDWAAQHKVDKFFIKWQAPKSSEPVGARASTAFAVPLIAGEELLHGIHRVNPRIVQALMGAVTGTISALEDHPLMRTINQVRSKVMAVDEAVKPQLYGALTQGSHMASHIMDAMRRKVRDGAWEVNKKSARIHWGRDGLYLAWPIAGKEILAVMKARGEAGVPASESTLAEMMASAGILAMGPGNQPFHMVYPVHEAESGENKICAVRLSKDMVFQQEFLEHFKSEPSPAQWNLTVGKPDPATGELPAQAPSDSPSPAVGSPGVSAGASQAQAKSPAPRPRTASKAAVTPEETSLGVRPTEITPGSVDVADVTESTTAQVEPAAPPAPAAEPSKPAKRGGAIAEVPDVKIDVDSIPPDLVAAMGLPLTREVIGWRDAWNSGRARKHFLLIEGDLGGVAVSVAHIHQTAAMDQVRLIEPLKSNGFLAAEVVGTKTKYARKIEFAEKTDLGYVLKRSFASRCGFVLDVVS